ncbi:MAG: hypothetical protein AAF092_04495 [Pseudomonadota bacterium]
MADIPRAFRRAAQHSPLYTRFHVYATVYDEDTGRPVAGTFDWVDTCHGFIQWRDLDKTEGRNDIAEGDGRASLITHWPFTPELIQDVDGTFYSVRSKLGMDAAGVATKLHVRFWRDDPPTIRIEAP